MIRTRIAAFVRTVLSVFIIAACAFFFGWALFVGIDGQLRRMRAKEAGVWISDPTDTEMIEADPDHDPVLVSEIGFSGAPTVAAFIGRRGEPMMAVGQYIKNPWWPQKDKSIQITVTLRGPAAEYWSMTEAAAFFHDEDDVTPERIKIRRCLVEGPHPWFLSRETDKQVWVLSMHRLQHKGYGFNIYFNKDKDGMKKAEWAELVVREALTIEVEPMEEMDMRPTTGEML